jgi:hypothetical protein
MVRPVPLALSAGDPAESVPVMSKFDEVFSREGSDVVQDASRTATSAAKTARPSPRALGGRSALKPVPLLNFQAAALRHDSSGLDYEKTTHSETWLREFALSPQIQISKKNRAESGFAGRHLAYF